MTSLKPISLIGRDQCSIRIQLRRIARQDGSRIKPRAVSLAVNRAKPYADLN